jgi:uncharacterized phage protein (TIGR01671 family)
MTREIKLRAWDNSLKKIRTSGISINKGVISSEDKDIILMQFTGLKDKNGKEIYEGDIVRVYATHKRLIPINFMIFEVVYEGTSFRIVRRGNYEFLGIVASYPNSLEVLGNIYENPELLEETK